MTACVDTASDSERIEEFAAIRFQVAIAHGSDTCSSN